MLDYAQPRPAFELRSLPLGGATYDAGQLYVFPALALLATLLVIVEPLWFLPVLVADVWLLGYHHVIATYTRTAFDREMFRRYWPLMVLLPPALFVALIGIANAGGAVAITTIYIHWQLFHYVRQSEGISKAFASRQPERTIPNSPRLRWAFYLLPVASFLTMASNSGSSFLGFPVWLPRLPQEWLALIWCVTAVSVLVASAELVQAARRGGISRQYLHFFISHILVFFVAYAIIADVLLSWLMANIWHNSQYLAFVWKANQLRFKGKVTPEARLLSTLVQPKNLWLYFTFCLTITAVIYFVVLRSETIVASITGLETIAVAAILYQTINFHHYVVDAIIWRRPKAVAPQSA